MASSVFIDDMWEEVWAPPDDLAVQSPWSVGIFEEESDLCIRSAWASRFLLLLSGRTSSVASGRERVRCFLN